MGAPEFYIPGSVRPIMVDSPNEVEAVWIPEAKEWHCGHCEHNLFFDQEPPALWPCPDCERVNVIQRYEPSPS